MKVSVCMITYNHEKYIKKAIESVLMQDVNFSYEIIIGEDVSTDDTRKIVKDFKEQYPEKIKLFLHEGNVGMQQNFLQTLMACKGEYVAICEGDDYWVDKNKLQKQVDFLENNSNFALTFHNVKVVNETVGKTKQFNHYKNEQIFTIEDVIKNWFIGTQSMLFRNVLNDIPFPVSFKKYLTTDRFLQIMIASKGLLKYFPQTMAVYRINDTSVTVKQKYGQSMKYFESSLMMFNDLKQLIDKKYSYLLDKTIKKIKEDREVAKAIDFSNNKNKKQTLLSLYKVVLSNPVRLFKQPRLFLGIIKKML